VLEALADLDLATLVEKPMPVKGPLKEAQAAIQVTSKKEAIQGKKKTWFGDWAPRVALGVVLALAVGARVDKGEIRVASASGKSEAAAEQSLPARLSLINPQASDSSLEHSPSTDRILHGQTIYRISLENLGRFDSKILAEIRNLNPWISDPARHQIVVPATQVSAADGQNAAVQGFSSSPREVGKE
jgi:hypothetical protein